MRPSRSHDSIEMCANTPGLGHVCRESYNDPAEVYERAKSMGMSVVTITDTTHSGG